MEKGHSEANFSDFSRFRTRLIRDHFIKQTVESYVTNEHKILSGDLEKGLIDANSTIAPTKAFLNVSLASTFIHRTKRLKSS